jgi:citrate synthase
MAIEYWTAREAAEFLGVSVTTLYAYVGRKGIVSTPVPGSREHRYLRADIERLKSGRGRHRSPAIAEGGASGITVLSRQGPYYRGHLATSLARTETLERTADILWQAEPSAFGEQPPACPARLRTLAKQLADRPAAYRAMALLPLLESADPRSYDLSPAGMARTGADILRWLTAILLGETSPATTPIHMQFAGHFGLSGDKADLMRRLLVLSADHGLEEAARAVRAVAVTGVTPWRAVVAGLLVVTGRASRLGRNQALLRMIREIEESRDGSIPVVSRLRDGEDIPGFGSDLYPEGDPRAEAILAFCDSAMPSDPQVRRLRQAVQMVWEVKGLKPNFTLASVFAEARMGLWVEETSDSGVPRDAPFMVGRSVGWIAHAIEQHGLSETERRAAPYRDGQKS